MLFFAISTILFVIGSLSILSQWSCDNIANNEQCQEIMYERYGLTLSNYNNMGVLHQMMMTDHLECVRENKCPLHLPRISGKEIECINGTSAGYPCNNVNLLSIIPLIELGSHINASGNDIWGYTQYDTNDNAIAYFALTCQTDGVSIVNITEPINPNVLAFIESNTQPIRHVNWRALKVYGEFAFVVADTTSNYDDHGLQIFNISNIIDIAYKHQLDVGFNEIYNISYGSNEYWSYTEFGGAHNLFINEESAYLYSIGTNKCGFGGLHIVDITDPYNPLQAGCFAHHDNVSYVHDVQCVNYHGPDQRYRGNEICFAFTPRTQALTIMDVSNKTEMILLSEMPYEYPSDTHQGWVTGDHSYLLMNDEIDEVEFNLTQKTLIWDVTNLTNPILFSIYDSNLTVINHNEYIIDNGQNNHIDIGYKGFVFQSNYEAGIRILNIDNIATGDLVEIAYFDNYIWSDNINYTVSDHNHNNPNYRGSWSVYPYFKLKRNEQYYSDIIISQNINTGLYVLRHNINLNDIFIQDNDASEIFWTQHKIITFSVIGALILLILFTMCAIYLYKVSTRNTNGDEAVPLNKNGDQDNQQMAAITEDGGTFT